MEVLSKKRIVLRVCIRLRVLWLISKANAFLYLSTHFIPIIIRVYQKACHAAVPPLSSGPGAHLIPAEDQEKGPAGAACRDSAGHGLCRHQPVWTHHRAEGRVGEVGSAGPALPCHSVKVCYFPPAGRASCLGCSVKAGPGHKWRRVGLSALFGEAPGCRCWLLFPFQSLDCWKKPSQTGRHRTVAGTLLCPGRDVSWPPSSSFLRKEVATWATCRAPQAHHSRRPCPAAGSAASCSGCG